MKYSITINQKYIESYGLKNINQAAILDLLITSSTWAEPIMIENELFFWVSRQKISDELKSFRLAPDTIYRHLRFLSENQFIIYKKQGRKDCVKLTGKGKKYAFDKLGNKSDFEQNSEINPSKLGNKSELNSEINPTYNNTNIYNNTKDNKKHTKSSFLSVFESELLYQFEAKKIKTFFDKVNLSVAKKNTDFKKLNQDNYKKIVGYYADYVKRNKSKAVRLNKWITAYFENNLKDIEFSDKQFINKDINVL